MDKETIVPPSWMVRRWPHASPSIAHPEASLAEGEREPAAIIPGRKQPPEADFRLPTRPDLPQGPSTTVMIEHDPKCLVVC